MSKGSKASREREIQQEREKRRTEKENRMKNPGGGGDYAIKKRQKAAGENGGRKGGLDGVSSLREETVWNPRTRREEPVDQNVFDRSKTFSFLGRDRDGHNLGRRGFSTATSPSDHIDEVLRRARDEDRSREDEARRKRVSDPWVYRW